MKINIAGINIDNLSKTEVLDKVEEFIKLNDYHYVVTPYSEFIVLASHNDHFKAALNGADLSLPDGAGVLWAAKFLSLHILSRSKLIRFLTVTQQLIISLLKTLLNPNYTKSPISERITGSSFFWDIVKLADDRHYSIALVGGKNNIAQKTAIKIKDKFPYLNIKLAISDMPFNDLLVNKIAASSSDILLIAYSPPYQELWLAENRQKLDVKVAFGLGGTFDYIGGKYPPAPNFMHYRGLEWAWRLLTQPWRLKRIWNAVPVFIWQIYRFKLNNS